MNHAYKVLEISEQATPAEIKKAYLKLAIKYHPDKNDNSSAAKRKMQEINIAYDILKDKELKSYYDVYKYFTSYNNIVSDISRIVERKNRNTYIDKK